VRWRGLWKSEPRTLYDPREAKGFLPTKLPGQRLRLCNRDVREADLEADLKDAGDEEEDDLVPDVVALQLPGAARWRDDVRRPSPGRRGRLGC